MATLERRFLSIGPLSVLRRLVPGAHGAPFRSIMVQGGMMESEKGRIGASFEAFLNEQGIREEVEGQAVKALIAEQISETMKAEGLSKVAMARRMHIPRAQLGRLLDPANPSVTLATLQRAAKAVGRNLTIALS